MGNEDLGDDAFRGFDGLTVDHSGGRVGLATGSLLRLHHQGMVDLQPCPSRDQR